jgi:hypothetical protein
MLALSSLKSQSRVKKNSPRLFAIFIAKQYSQATHQKIAHYFTKIKANSISTHFKRFEAVCKSNIEMEKHMENLRSILLADVD